jgi:hypothetical protein
VRPCYPWLTPLLAASALALGGCASTSSVATVNSSVAAAEEALTAAETAAALYTGLPPCGTGAPAICANPSIVAQIKAADNEAYAAVKAAESNSGTLAAALTAIGSLTDAIPKPASGS